MSPFPYIQVSGTAYHMGAEYGRQCQPQINCFLEMLMAGRDRGQTLRRTRVFAPHFDHHVPQFVEQVRGLADGAGISFEEALLIQIRGEIDQGGSGPACTVFAVGPGVTASGQVLIGQNADLTDQFERIGVVLHLIPKSGPQILMWTFGGLLGYHGMNSQGVAQFANALGGGPGWRLALPHYPIKQQMLQKQTVAECLEVLDQIPVCSSGNYVLTGGCGRIIDVELTPEGYTMHDDEGENFIVHTNHFLSPRFASPHTDAQSLKDSFPRLCRLQRLIRDHAGQLCVEQLQQLLADHDNHPVSICRHRTADDATKTTACLIAEPEAGKFHVGCGNPCEKRFATYQFDR